MCVFMRLCRNLDKYPEASTTPGVLVVRLDAPLFFANTPHFEAAIKRRMEEGAAEARDAGCELCCLGSNMGGVLPNSPACQRLGAAWVHLGVGDLQQHVCRSLPVGRRGTSKLSNTLAVHHWAKQRLGC